METMIIHPKNKDQTALFEHLAKVLNVRFEINVEQSSTERDKAVELYGKDIVEKVERGEKAFKEGKGVIVDVDNLWK